MSVDCVEVATNFDRSNHVLIRGPLLQGPAWRGGEGLTFWGGVPASAWCTGSGPLPPIHTDGPGESCFSSERVLMLPPRTMCFRMTNAKGGGADPLPFFFVPMVELPIGEASPHKAPKPSARLWNATEGRLSWYEGLCLHPERCRSRISGRLLGSSEPADCLGGQARRRLWPVAC